MSDAISLGMKILEQAWNIYFAVEASGHRHPRSGRLKFEMQSIITGDCGSHSCKKRLAGSIIQAHAVSYVIFP
jgi:hypothetical protein